MNIGTSFARIRQGLADRFAALPHSSKAILWAVAAGLIFSAMNMLMRHMTLQLHPFEAQFLRQFFGLLVMLPIVIGAGLARFKTASVPRQFGRGALHALGTSLWFFALPHLAWPAHRDQVYRRSFDDRRGLPAG
jgi:hypothetical protein